jgi:phosphatidylcholine synthase
MTLLVVVVLAAAMMTPLKFVHPMRTKRWRLLTLPVALVWTVLAGWSAWHDFEHGPLTGALLVFCSLYLVLAGIVQQGLDRLRGQA